MSCDRRCYDEEFGLWRDDDCQECEGRDTPKSKAIHPCPDCAELRQENEALRKRLEINPVAPEYDGIACRDETIKQLERQVRELKLALESDYR